MLQQFLAWKMITTIIKTRGRLLKIIELCSKVKIKIKLLENSIKIWIMNRHVIKANIIYKKRKTNNNGNWIFKGKEVGGYLTAMQYQKCNDVREERKMVCGKEGRAMKRGWCRPQYIYSLKVVTWWEGPINYYFCL